MQGAGHADLLLVLQLQGNKADDMPYKRLRKIHNIEEHNIIVKIRDNA